MPYTVNLNGDSIAVATGASGGQVLWLNGVSGSTMHVRNSLVVGTGTNTSLLQISAGNKFFEDGGNTLTNGTVANGIPAGTFFGGKSACEVAQVAGNFADGAGLGTSTFGTVSGNGCYGQVTVTYAGTLATPATWTMTFPRTFFVTPSCTVTDIGGTNPFPTQIVSSATTTTLTTTMTFAAAPVATNTDIFVWNCSN